MKGFNIATAAPPSNSVSLLSEVMELDPEHENDSLHYDKKSPKVRESFNPTPSN
jgi:hypothetical protein